MTATETEHSSAIHATRLAEARRRIAFRRRLTWCWRNKALVLAAVIWLILICAAAFPSWFASGDANAQDLLLRLAPPGTPHHPLGTDELGEDVYTRLVYGARTTCLVGFGAVAVGGVIGITLGMVGGYFRRANGVVTTIINIKMAFPGLLLALTVVVALGRSSIPILVLVIGLIGWTRYARVLRGLSLSLRERDFIAASKMSGSGSIRILAFHILPNVAGAISVLAVLDLSSAVLAEAGLSFLGFGIEPPLVSWGLMLAAGEDYIYQAWWLVTFPGIAIALVVLAANIVARVLQQWFDPTGRTVRRRF